MRWIAFIAAAALASGCGSSMDKHLAASRADGKVLVLEFYTQWCSACKKFDRTVLVDPTVERALEQVRFVRYDAESAAGRTHAQRYGVRAFPTFVVVDAGGDAVAIIRGLPTASRFVSFLEWGPVHALDEGELQARLDASPTTHTLLLAARFYATDGQLERSVTYYDRVLDALDDPGRVPDIAWERTLIASAGGELRPLAEAAADYMAAHPRAAHVLDALGLAVLSGGLDTGEAREAARALVTAVADDPAALNGIVYTLLAASLLDVALDAAAAQVELVPEDANAWDTLAETHHYRRERDAALAAADAAIERAASSSQRAMFEENRRRFAADEHLGTDQVDAIAAKTQTLLADLRVRGATSR